MFQISSNSRIGIAKLVSEIIASYGLILTILMVRESNKSNVAIAVAFAVVAIEMVGV